MTPGEILNAVLARKDIDQVRYAYRRRDDTDPEGVMGDHRFKVERRDGEEIRSQSFCVTEEFLADIRPDAGQRFLVRHIASLLSEETVE